MRQFRRSEWFNRGWTLQELLAPRTVCFLSQEWDIIGYKTTGLINQTIAEITRIPREVIFDYSVTTGIATADKMAWVANRRITKPEDIAYCLLGIFDVHMSLIYGEGAANARARLEEEIAKKQTQKQGQQLSMVLPSSEVVATQPSKSPLDWLLEVSQSWRKVWSEQHKAWFYVNSYTNESQWGKPTSAITGRAIKPPPPKVPDGWGAVWNEEQEAWFYVDLRTKESHWQLPASYYNKFSASNGLPLSDRDHRSAAGSLTFPYQPEVAKDIYGIPLGHP